MTTDSVRTPIAIAGGFLIGLVVIIMEWDLLPATIFIVLMLIAYDFLFPKLRQTKSAVDTEDS